MSYAADVCRPVYGEFHRQPAAFRAGLKRMRTVEHMEHARQAELPPRARVPEHRVPLAVGLRDVFR